MASISIRQLALAMCKRNFAELVTYQIRTNSYSGLSSAMGEAKNCLPPEIRFEIEGIVRTTDDITTDKRFWYNDCGMVLRLFTTIIEKHLSDRFINSSDKELIEIFHIIVMHCAYRARKDPRMINFLRRVGVSPGTAPAKEQQQFCQA